MEFELRQLWDRLEEGERWLARGGREYGDTLYTSLGHTARQMILLPLEEEISRVQRVRLALSAAGPRAQRMMGERLAGIDFATVWPILLQAIEDIAFYLGGAVALGGAGGFVLGGLVGGVGAVPGAALGATVGGEIGGWILAFLGLKSLAEGLLDTLPQAAHCYAEGVMRAWGATHWDHRYGDTPSRDGNIEFAAAEIARGHVLLLTALLIAIVAYLTRGKGNRSRLFKEIRESKRLGPKVAEWLEKYEKLLAEHPTLKMRERPRAASEEMPSQAMTPSQIRKAKERGRDPKTEFTPEGRAAESEPKELGSHEKAAFGERTAHDKMVEKGYEPVGKTDGNYEPGKTGIDGVYRNPSPPPDYVITEAKYKGVARLDKDLADGTNQMDDVWVRKRLVDKVGLEEAENISSAMNKQGSVEKWLLKVDESGATSATKINAAGSPVRGGAGRVVGW